MTNGYSRLKAEQQSGIPWSELIDLMMSAPEPKPYGWETMSVEELAAFKSDPSVVQNEAEMRKAVSRYRASKNAPVSATVGNVIFGELESRGFIRRDQDGTLYAMQKDATFKKLM